MGFFPTILGKTNGPGVCNRHSSVRKQASKVIVFLHPLNRAKIDHGLASLVVVSSSPLFFEYSRKSGHRASLLKQFKNKKLGIVDFKKNHSVTIAQVFINQNSEDNRAPPQKFSAQKL